MTLDNEDGLSLSDSSNAAYSFSETLSPSNQLQTESTNAQLASILGTSNSSLMSNVLNSVLNNTNLKQQLKLDKSVEQEDNNYDTNLPSSPESANSSLNDEEDANDK